MPSKTYESYDSLGEDQRKRDNEQRARLGQKPIRRGQEDANSDISSLASVNMNHVMAGKKPPKPLTKEQRKKIDPNDPAY